VYKNEAGDGQLLLSNSKKIVQISSGAKTAQMLGPTVRPETCARPNIKFPRADQIATVERLTDPVHNRVALAGQEPGKAQSPRVEASQGVYCSGFIQPNKQTNKYPRMERGVDEAQAVRNSYLPNCSRSLLSHLPLPHK